MNAERACTMGMVNRVTTRDALATQTRAIAHKLAAQPRMALALTKQSINHVEDLRGKRTAMDAAFGWHHFAPAHNTLDRKSVGSGKRVSGRVDHGGRRIIKKKKNNKTTPITKKKKK